MTDPDRRRCETCAAPFTPRQWNHKFCTARCRQVDEARRMIARCQAKLAELDAPVAPARWQSFEPTPEQAAQVETYEDRLAAETQLAAREGVTVGAMLTAHRRIIEALIECAVGSRAVRPWFAAVLADLTPDDGKEPRP